jgi:hypothetical protein
MSWAKQEFSTLDLGDPRLDKRTVLLAERLANKPGASIPNACLNWSETIAAYRYFSNPEVGWEDVLTAHADASKERIAQHPVVLCLQDTTDLNYNGQEINGLGPLSYEVQRGLYLHPTYAITPDREPLGVINAWTWAREFKADDGTRGGILESKRWIESYERVAEQALQLPNTRHVCVSDRESDIMALMVRARDLNYPADYLVRSRHNRALPTGGKLWKDVENEAILGHVIFDLPAGRGRKARKVTQALRVKRVTLKDGAKGTIDATCIVATEINPPANVKPVIWRLLTNREAISFDQVCELIDWYRARWEIELFFLVLKEGCRVERLQLGSSEKLETALALFMVIAWRINRLMRLGRSMGDIAADLVFETDEWKAAFILNKKAVPKEVPPLKTVIRLIAQRGGFLARKRDGDPGAKSIWLGMQDIAVFVEGMRYAREVGAL